MQNILKQLLLCSIIIYSLHAFSTPTTIDTASTTTFTNFNKDLGSCNCDVSTACDTFCCCDTKCASDLVTKWTTNSWCVQTPSEIQKLCEKIGVKGFATFQDLACVMFTNRGSIGQYYTTPNSNNFVDPNIKKLYNISYYSSTYTLNAQSISQEGSAPTTPSYQSGSALKIQYLSSGVLKNAELLAWFPSVGQSCRKGYISIAEGTNSYNCIYSVLNAAHCTEINKHIVGNTFKFCSVFDCSALVTPSPTTASVADALYTTGTCSGAITSVDISILIDYTNGQYRVTSGSIIFTASTITSQKATLSTRISITKASTISQTSGNPGYIVGKPLRFSTGNILQIADANNNCRLSSAPSTNSLGIKFGVNQTFTCLSSNPCASALYVDGLALANTFSLLKYASRSTDQVSLSGLGSLACNAESINLNILYSYSGWILDPQYYILGGSITRQNSVNSNSQIKQLNVKWIKVEPSQVYTPPTNNFYTYFQKLWIPLKSAFYRVAAN